MILKIALDIEMKSSHNCSRIALLHFLCDIGCVVISFWYFHLENLIVQQIDIKLWTIFLDLSRELQNIVNDKLFLRLHCTTIGVHWLNIIHKCVNNVFSSHSCNNM